MAVRFDTAGERLSRTASLPDFNAAYTWMAWVYTAVDDGTTHRVLSANAAGANATPHDEFNTFLDGTSTHIAEYRAESTSLNGSAFSLNTWHHAALVRTSDTVLLGYLDGVLDGTNTHASVSGRTGITEIDIGGLVAAANRFHNGRIAYVKLWTRALSAAEVMEERRSVRPRNPTSIWAWWPLFPGSDAMRGRDYSGNGRDLTANGTLADEDPPPVRYGTRPRVGISTVVAPSIQTAVPISDVSAGGWTPSTGTDLYAMVDETVADDTDWIQSSINPVADTAEVALTSLTDPVSSTGHVVRYRIRMRS